MNETKHESAIGMVCPAEKRVVAWVRGKSGACVDAQAVRKGLYNVNVDHDKALRGQVTDGSALVCPRCGNVLRACRDGQTISRALNEDVVFMVGQMVFP